MIFVNLINALFGTISRLDLAVKEKHEVADISNPSCIPGQHKGKYCSDVEALEHRWGIFTSGLCIEEELQDMLVICPRTRHRTDAYKGLVSYLKKEYGVSLTIRSRKRR